MVGLKSRSAREVTRWTEGVMVVFVRVWSDWIVGGSPTILSGVDRLASRFVGRPS